MPFNRRVYLVYGLVSALFCLAIYALILMGSRHFGEPAGRMAPAVDAQQNSNTLFLTLSALLIILIVSRTVGAVFKKLGQPQVMGEVVGGILLGPSFLSSFAPELMAHVMPAQIMPFLGVIAQIGVLLYMFVIGLELDLSVIRRAGHLALSISHASIVIPCLLGVGLSFWIYRDHAPPGVSFSSFALFIGVALSITAFPVLARILADAKMHKTKIGALALSSAAIGDATAWCLLAIVVGIAQASMTDAYLTLGLTVVYFAFMFLVVKKVFARAIPWLEKSSEHLSETSMAIVLICLLISALATELIGIHALFGAFLLGAIIPNESRVAADLDMRLNDLARVFFLPAFFAFTGLRTQIGLLESMSDLVLCLIVIGIATLGKFGGSYLAARMGGMPRRDSATLGILMNTRGLVELIVLNVGLDLGVLTPRLFTVFVIMAVVTTLVTGPALRRLK